MELGESNHSSEAFLDEEERNRSRSRTPIRERFVCMECSKELSSKQCLKEHIYKHTSEKPYSCKVCKKKFRYASQVTVHKKTHVLTTRFLWPKLTDLMKDFSEFEPMHLEYSEKIHLPPLNGPQEHAIPSIQDLIRRLNIS